MKLLHVDSGILGELSVSRRLSASVVAHWRRAVPGLEVVERDLARDPLPHLSGAMLAAQAGGEDVPEALRHNLAESEAVLAEFLAADVVVVGAPMYNFAIPSQLKAWIDRLAVRGRTFRYTADGPEGLAGGRKVIVASARGGFYGPGTPAEALDHQESYLRGVFGFLGIADVEFVRAEGVASGPEAKDRAIASAEAAIPSLLAA